jgi:hypothetical protein
MTAEQEAILSVRPEHSREDLIWKLLKAGAIVTDLGDEIARLKAQIAVANREYRVIIPRFNKPIIHSYTDPDKARRTHESFSRIARHWPLCDGEVRLESRTVTPWVKHEEGGEA